MFSKERNSLTRLAVAVLVGSALLGTASVAHAQQLTRSGRQLRDTKSARGVLSMERSALRAHNTPVAQLAMTFTEPVGLGVRSASTASSGKSAGFVAKPLDADGTEWGIYGIRNGASSQAFDVIVFRRHVLVVAENAGITTGFLVFFDRETELVDAVATYDDDVVASIVDYDVDLREVLDPTTESAAEFREALATYAGVALTPTAGDLLPALVGFATEEPPTVSVEGDPDPPDPSTWYCCRSTAGCTSILGGCPGGTTYTSCPCAGSE